MNNPLKYIDLWGLAAGDPFSSRKDALEDMYYNYYGVTKYTGFELSAGLYTWEEAGVINYSYTVPDMGSPTRATGIGNTKSNIPSGKTFLAYIHTHPDDFVNDDRFSRGDVEWVKYYGDFYLFTNAGYVRFLCVTKADKINESKWNINGTKGKVISSGLSTRELISSDKNILMRIYGPKMEQFNNDVGFLDKRTSQAYKDFKKELKAIKKNKSGTAPTFVAPATLSFPLNI